ncbi:hypothetical protein ANN_20558 [Periplaneta americana]|uniref:Uncharacterized protein n=1 Tax=Periplaneta americana TaxID=6978 RepID=A0ABQ8SD00_PERAM|nr:hypothetical protein ANN_20558 [Periplaneta americana]
MAGLCEGGNEPPGSLKAMEDPVAHPSDQSAPSLTQGTKQKANMEEGRVEQGMGGEMDNQRKAVKKDYGKNHCAVLLYGIRHFSLYIYQQ